MRKLIVLFGPPGSGKGLLGDLLVKNTKIKKVSTGDILRREAKELTELGIQIASQVSSGTLLDDKIVNSIVEKELFDSDEDILLDGYPRRFSQLTFFMNLIQSKFVLGCIYMSTPTDIILNRIDSRRVCEVCGTTHFKEQGCCPECGGKSIIRVDDKNIQKRIDFYYEVTKPVFTQSLIHYCSRFACVDGTNINEGLPVVLDLYKSLK